MVISIVRRYWGFGGGGRFAAKRPSRTVLVQYNDTRDASKTRNLLSNTPIVSDKDVPLSSLLPISILHELFHPCI